MQAFSSVASTALVETPVVTPEETARQLLAKIHAESDHELRMQAILSGKDLFRPLWDSASAATEFAAHFISDLYEYARSNGDSRRHEITAAAIEFVRYIARENHAEALKLATEIRTRANGMLYKGMGNLARELETGRPSGDLIGNPDKIVALRIA